MNKKTLVLIIGILCFVIITMFYLLVPQFASVKKEYKTKNEQYVQTIIQKQKDNTSFKKVHNKDKLKQKYENYKVRLSGDKKLKIPGLEGYIKVWIGKNEFLPLVKIDETYDETKINALSQWAKVEPYSSGFEFFPDKSVCIKIHETGSEITFKIKPIQEGIHKVGAKVELYEKKACKGVPIPKTTANLKIEVEADYMAYIKVYSLEILEITWNAFRDFWGAFIVIFFGFILFLFRKKLKERFGYEN